MPATPEDIAAGSRDAKVVSWSDEAVRAAFPNARDGSLEVAEGFFDSAEDAQAVLDQRAALIGAIGRRRLTVDVADITWIDPTSGAPTASVDDPEQGGGTMIVTRAEVDIETETTQLEVFG